MCLLHLTQHLWGEQWEDTILPCLNVGCIQIRQYHYWSICRLFSQVIDWHIGASGHTSITVRESGRSRECGVCVCGREQVKQQRETGSKRKTVKTQSQNNPGQNCDNMCVCALFPLVWTCCISCYYSCEDILVLLRLFGPFRIVSLRWLGATEYIMATMAMFSSEIWRVYVLILLINDLLLVL